MPPAKKRTAPKKRKGRTRAVKPETISNQTKSKKWDDDSPQVWSHVRHLRCPAKSKKYPQFLGCCCGHLMKPSSTPGQLKFWVCPVCDHRQTTKGVLV